MRRRRGIDLIHEIREGQDLSAVVEQRNVKVTGVDQFGKNAVNGGKKFIQVAGRIGFFGNPVKSCLQLLALLALGDIEGRAQQSHLSFKGNETAAEVNPAGFTQLGDDSILVAGRRGQATLAVGEALADIFAIFRMHERPGVQFQNFITCIARDHFAAAVTEQKAGSLVDVNGRSRGLGNCAEFAFTFTQGLFGMFPFGSFQGKRNQVGHRTGKIFFVERPAPLVSGVGCAEDSQHLPAGANRSFHEGGDVVLDEVQAVELLGAGIGGRVISIDRPLFCNGREILGRVMGEKLSAVLVFLAAADELIFATQRGTVLVKEPDGGALDFQDFSRGLCNFLQGFGEVATVNRFALREFTENFVLPA